MAQFHVTTKHRAETRKRLAQFVYLALFVLFILQPIGLLANSGLPADSPSGILIDRVASLAQIETLGGSADAGQADLPRWRQAVFELRRAASRDLGWPSARKLQSEALSPTPRTTIPLALVHARYDRLGKSGALSSHRAFAFAPLRETNYFPRQTQFSIARENVLDHGTEKIVSLSFDAGDGLGFRPLQWDVPLAVTYQRSGAHRLALRATLADGTTLLARSTIEVIEGPTPPEPSETWPVTATEQYLGEAGTGQAYLYLADGHSELTNPVVVVEGFDIDNSIDWPVLYQLLNRENLLEDLRTLGYDAVVLDFTEAVEPIQRNSFVLTRLIEMVQAEIDPAQDIALVGASMGGLVSRYGLLWMEDQAIDHRVRNFISFDTPHGGANIPLGLQHWLSFFAEQSEEAEYFLSRLNSDAARQMLLYHLESTAGTAAAPDPLLAAFNGDLAALGGWPQDTRLSTVINGSGAMIDQGFDAGAQIIEWVYRSLLVDIDGNVWAVPDGGSQVIFDGLIDFVLLPAETETVTIANTLPWDNAPGGYRSTMDQLAEVPAPYGDIIALHGAHSFIPSVSALAIESADPFYDIAGDVNLLDHVPFDTVYFPAANQEHIEITAENKPWFISEIEFGVPSNVIFTDGFESLPQF